MTGWTRKIRGSLLIFLLLSACAAGGLTGNSPSATPSITDLPSNTPTETIVPTPTLINTIVALPSPTKGPPPDLELLNLTLRDNGDGWGSLFGEIRNNTNSAMVFPINEQRQDIPILRFQTKAWESNGVLTAYWFEDFSIGKGNDESWHTSCFLYPGETGPFRIDAFGCQNELDTGCKSDFGMVEGIPEATGMQLVGYQDLKTYIPWPDLYPGYHPQVENLEFTATEDSLEFGFDILIKNYDPHYDITSWVFVYDENNNILGILNMHASQEYSIDTGEGTFHIDGYIRIGAGLGQKGTRFYGTLLNEDYKNIDHLRVWIEFQHIFLCQYYRYDDYREYMKEHPGLSVN